MRRGEGSEEEDDDERGPTNVRRRGELQLHHGLRGLGWRLRLIRGQWRPWRGRKGENLHKESQKEEIRRREVAQLFDRWCLLTKLLSRTSCATAMARRGRGCCCWSAGPPCLPAFRPYRVGSILCRRRVGAAGALACGSQIPEQGMAGAGPARAVGLGK